MPVGDVIQVRRGSTAEWSTADPVLADGEPGWDRDGTLKIGDGTTPWSELAAIGGGVPVGVTLTGDELPTTLTLRPDVGQDDGILTVKNENDDWTVFEVRQSGLTVDPVGLPGLLYLTDTFSELILGASTQLVDLYADDGLAYVEARAAVGQTLPVFRLLDEDGAGLLTVAPYNPGAGRIVGRIHMQGDALDNTDLDIWPSNGESQGKIEMAGNTGWAGFYYLPDVRAQVSVGAEAGQTDPVVDIYDENGDETLRVDAGGRVKIIGSENDEWHGGAPHLQVGRSFADVPPDTEVHYYSVAVRDRPGADGIDGVYASLYSQDATGSAFTQATLMSTAAADGSGLQAELVLSAEDATTSGTVLATARGTYTQVYVKASEAQTAALLRLLDENGNPLLEFDPQTGLRIDTPNGSTLDVGGDFASQIDFYNPAGNRDARVIARDDAVFMEVHPVATQTAYALAIFDVGDTAEVFAVYPDGRVASLVPSDDEADSFTLRVADHGRVVHTTKATAMNVTFPQNSDVAIPIGATGELYQAGAGQFTCVAGTGATLRAPGGAKSRVQYSTVAWRKVATNEFVITGDTTT